MIKQQSTTIILSAPYTLGWVGIGFSKDGMMVGSCVMVGWINKHGHAKIKQFYLRAKKPSEVLEDKGELPLNNLPAAVATNGAEIHLAFQLKMELHWRGNKFFWLLVLNIQRTITISPSMMTKHLLYLILLQVLRALYHHLMS
ncbi:hypothetical protein HN51_020623 [Arachis hypogaea]